MAVTAAATETGFFREASVCRELVSKESIGDARHLPVVSAFFMGRFAFDSWGAICIRNSNHRYIPSLSKITPTRRSHPGGLERYSAISKPPIEFSCAEFIYFQ